MEYCAEGRRCPGCPARGLAPVSRSAIADVMAAVSDAAGWDAVDRTRSEYLDSAAAEALRDAGSVVAANNNEVCRSIVRAASRILNNDCTIQEK